MAQKPTRARNGRRVSNLPDTYIECRDNLEFMSGLTDGMFQLNGTSPPCCPGAPYVRNGVLWRKPLMAWTEETPFLDHSNGGL